VRRRRYAIRPPGFSVSISVNAECAHPRSLHLRGLASLRDQAAPGRVQGQPCAAGSGIPPKKSVAAPPGANNERGETRPRTVQAPQNTQAASAEKATCPSASLVQREALLHRRRFGRAYRVGRPRPHQMVYEPITHRTIEGRSPIAARLKRRPTPLPLRAVRFAHRS
jgi:hypothetical protein